MIGYNLFYLIIIAINEQFNNIIILMRILGYSATDESTCEITCEIQTRKIKIQIFLTINVPFI